MEPGALQAGRRPFSRNVEQLALPGFLQRDLQRAAAQQAGVPGGAEQFHAVPARGIAGLQNGKRPALQPADRGGDIVAATLKLAAPTKCADDRGERAFLVSAIAHLVADELTRKHDYHLPPHAPTGFQPVEAEDFDDPGVIEIAAIARPLVRTASECALGPLHQEEIDRKRWEVLGRWPLSEGRGRYLVVEPLATLVRHCAGEALMRMYRSEAGAALLGSWRT